MNNLGIPVIALGRSFMYNRNNKGPNVDPCATPYDIDFIVELVPLIQTNCCRFKKDWIKDWAGPRML